MAVKDLYRRHGFSEASAHLWRGTFGGMSVSDAKRLKEFETAPTRREGVRERVTRGLSERRALRVVGMSAAALRHVPAPDREGPLLAPIVALAHRSTLESPVLRPRHRRIPRRGTSRRGRTHVVLDHKSRRLRPPSEQPPAPPRATPSFNIPARARTRDVTLYAPA